MLLQQGVNYGPQGLQIMLKSNNEVKYSSGRHDLCPCWYRGTVAFYLMVFLRGTPWHDDRYHQIKELKYKNGTSDRCRTLIMYKPYVSIAYCHESGVLHRHQRREINSNSSPLMTRTINKASLCSFLRYPVVIYL